MLRQAEYSQLDHASRKAIIEQRLEEIILEDPNIRAYKGCYFSCDECARYQAGRVSPLLSAVMGAVVIIVSIGVFSWLLGIFE